MPVKVWTVTIQEGEFYVQVWMDQLRGKPKGAQPMRVFPEVDPDTQGQVNSMLRVRASVLPLLLVGMTVTITQKLYRQSWKSLLHMS